MTQTGYDVQAAAEAWRLGRYQFHGMDPQYTRADLDLAFAAGVEWQQARPSTMSIVHDGVREIFDRERLELVFRQAAAKQGQAENVPVALMVSDLSSNQNDAFDEIRNAIATLGDGMAEMLKRQSELAACALRGADRGVATLKHLQEIGDNVRGVSGAIGDKFGVVLDAVRHVGETVEATLDAVLVAKAENDPDFIDAPVSDEMGERPYLKEYISEIGKEWAKVPVNLEDVNDATLKDLATSEQIDGRQYWQEVDRRQKERLNKMAYDDANGRLYAAGLDKVDSFIPNKQVRDRPGVYVGMDLASPGSDVTGYQIIVKNPATFRDVCVAIETVCEISRAAGVVLDFTVKAQA